MLWCPPMVKIVQILIDICFQQPCLMPKKTIIFGSCTILILWWHIPMLIAKKIPVLITIFLWSNPIYLKKMSYSNPSSLVVELVESSFLWSIPHLCFQSQPPSESASIRPAWMEGPSGTPVSPVMLAVTTVTAIGVIAVTVVLPSDELISNCGIIIVTTIVLL